MPKKTRITPVPNGAVKTPNAGTDPTESVVVFGDDGQFHLLTKDTWSAAPVIGSDDAGYATLKTLVSEGTYLAYLPSGAGIGTVCTLVNLQTIIKNNT
jgi:hypothetical protein